MFVFFYVLFGFGLTFTPNNCKDHFACRVCCFVVFDVSESKASSVEADEKKRLCFVRKPTEAAFCKEEWVVRLVSFSVTMSVRPASDPISVLPSNGPK